MIKLRDATLTNALPTVLSTQPWVRALAATWIAMQSKMLGFADASKIFTNISEVSEQMLDILAVQLKVEWYKTEYPLKTKRKLIQSAMEVWRTMGTIHAVRTAVSAIFPDSEVEEWFTYDGEPGLFRIILNITDITGSVQNLTDEDMLRAVNCVKRWSAKLESTSLMIKRGLVIGHNIVVYPYFAIFCGIPFCGEHPDPACIGYSVHPKMALRAAIGAYLTQPPPCGMAFVGNCFCGNTDAGGERG